MHNENLYVHICKKRFVFVFLLPFLLFAISCDETTDKIKCFIHVSIEPIITRVEVIILLFIIVVTTCQFSICPAREWNKLFCTFGGRGGNNVFSNMSKPFSNSIKGKRFFFRPYFSHLHGRHY